jgi:hypothetical protein
MLFIGNFVFANNQEKEAEEDRRHGEFSLIIEANDPNEAIKKFRERLFEYRNANTFFEGNCSIYLIQLFEFDRFPSHSAMMLNFKSTVGDPLLPFIRCTLPTDLTDTCKLSDWKNNAPESDDRREKLFLRFEAGSNRLITDHDDPGDTLSSLP